MKNKLLSISTVGLLLISALVIGCNGGVNGTGEAPIDPNGTYTAVYAPKDIDWPDLAKGTKDGIRVDSIPVKIDVVKNYPYANNNAPYVTITKRAIDYTTGSYIPPTDQDVTFAGNASVEKYSITSNRQGTFTDVGVEQGIGVYQVTNPGQAAGYPAPTEALSPSITNLSILRESTYEGVVSGTWSVNPTSAVNDDFYNQIQVQIKRRWTDSLGSYLSSPTYHTVTFVGSGPDTVSNDFTNGDLVKIEAKADGTGKITNITTGWSSGSTFDYIGTGVGSINLGTLANGTVKGITVGDNITTYDTVTVATTAGIDILIEASSIYPWGGTGADASIPNGRLAVGDPVTVSAGSIQVFANVEANIADDSTTASIKRILTPKEVDRSISIKLDAGKWTVALANGKVNKKDGTTEDPYKNLPLLSGTYTTYHNANNDADANKIFFALTTAGTKVQYLPGKDETEENIDHSKAPAAVTLDPYNDADKAIIDAFAANSKASYIPADDSFNLVDGKFGVAIEKVSNDKVADKKLTAAEVAVSAIEITTPFVIDKLW
ncbi:hypothetical protein FACS1894106_2340 [Spirochaetia bacterium]|nr:hypothetical protein FACS1894106_2340 [Spirochaetia bacterium]